MPRYIIQSIILVAEFVLFLFLIICKKCHTRKGYLLAAAAFILFILCGKFILFPPVKAVNVKGTYTAGTWSTYFVDEDRMDPYHPSDGARELPVQFWYPENYDSNEKCPLVLFSHGSFGVKESNETLYRYLACNGYVVCSIDHTYHAFKTKLSNGKTVRMDMGYVKELGNDSPKKDPETSVKHFQKWMKIRMDDINCVLDSIIEKVNAGDKNMVYQIIAPERIGVMGHSLGGSAALGIGRDRTDIKAVIALESPFMADVIGAKDNGEFLFCEEEYPVPVMNVYSDSSWTHLKEWKQYAENVELLESTRSDVKNVHLEGLGHMALTDFSMTSPFLTALLDGQESKKSASENLKKINDLCIEFFDAYLK